MSTYLSTRKELLDIVHMTRVGMTHFRSFVMSALCKGCEGQYKGNMGEQKLHELPWKQEWKDEISHCQAANEKANNG